MAVAETDDSRWGRPGGCALVTMATTFGLNVFTAILVSKWSDAGAARAVRAGVETTVIFVLYLWGVTLLTRRGDRSTGLAVLITLALAVAVTAWAASRVVTLFYGPFPGN